MRAADPLGSAGGLGEFRRNPPEAGPARYVAVHAEEDAHFVRGSLTVVESSPGRSV